VQSGVRNWLPHFAAWTTAVSLVLGGLGCAAPAAARLPQAAVQAPAQWSTPGLGLSDTPTDLSGWWRRFEDPLLNSLVEDALGANTDVITARAAVQQAAALRDASLAALSPTLGYSANAQRILRGDRTSANSLAASLNAAWAPDVFGGLQSAVDASDANLRSVTALLGNVQGLVASGVALNYISLRGNQIRLRIARDNLDSQLETLQITRWRNQAGLVGTLEVEQATVAAGQTRAQIEPLQASLDATAHALSVQTGRPPADLLGRLAAQPLEVGLPQASQPLGAATPREALRQRADVRSAQHQLEQAQASLERARTLRYPTFSVGSTLGVGAASADALSTSGASLLTLALGLVGPLFDGGAAQAQIHAQEAAVDQARSAFAAAELNALREVEDAMSALRTEAQRVSQLQGVAVSAGNAATLARQQYESGLVDFQTVLETQRSLLLTQDGLAVANANLSSDQVRLYQALGGGWRPAETPSPEPATAVFRPQAITSQAP
jgi:NodT family efflux transporter outer membrane factor (OMF) lipoprotein